MCENRVQWFREITFVNRCRGNNLTHLSLVPNICNSLLVQHCFSEWLVTCLVPSHYLNQWWRIVNRSFRNKLQWNSNQNIKLFIDENAFENVICKRAAILSRERWVKPVGNMELMILINTLFFIACHQFVLFVPAAVYEWLALWGLWWDDGKLLNHIKESLLINCWVEW